MNLSHLPVWIYRKLMCFLFPIACKVWNIRIKTIALALLLGISFVLPQWHTPEPQPGFQGYTFTVKNHSYEIVEHRDGHEIVIASRTLQLTPGVNVATSLIIVGLITLQLIQIIPKRKPFTEKIILYFLFGLSIFSIALYFTDAYHLHKSANVEMDSGFYFRVVTLLLMFGYCIGGIIYFDMHKSEIDAAAM